MDARGRAAVIVISVTFSPNKSRITNACEIVNSVNTATSKETKYFSLLTTYQVKDRISLQDDIFRRFLVTELDTGVSEV